MKQEMPAREQKKILAKMPRVDGEELSLRSVDSFEFSTGGFQQGGKTPRERVAVF